MSRDQSGVNWEGYREWLGRVYYANGLTYSELRIKLLELTGETLVNERDLTGTHWIRGTNRLYVPYNAGMSNP